ncbi:MAG TPA: hypothetical protein VK783_03845 [Bacteroidia bacterium]|nr:hypothetical protein [Bacteroidia bacterium]
MKTFAKYLIALFCLVFIVDKGLGYIFNKLYLQNRVGDTGGKINYYLSLQAPDLLIMGSSRSIYVIPDSFNVSCFNLGHAGMVDDFHTGLLHVLIAHNKAPKTILLQIDPETYCSLDTDKYEKSIQNLLYYYGKDELVTEYINGISFHERFFYLFHLFRFNGRAFNLIGNALKSYRSFKPNNGYDPLPASPEDSASTVNLATKVNRDGPLVISRMKYLFRFIELCKQNNIKLIAFTSPLYANHFQEPAAFDSILRLNNIPYINYLKLGLPSVENKPYLWKDPVHLNSIGATYASGDLARRFKQLTGVQNK